MPPLVKRSLCQCPLTLWGPARRPVPMWYEASQHVQACAGVSDGGEATSRRRAISPGRDQGAILYARVIVSAIRPPAASAAVTRSVTYEPAGAVNAAR
jgi:hypothetical protein